MQNINDINTLMHNNDFHTLGMNLLGAFEQLNKKNDYSYLQSIFDDYFSPFHKLLDFFDQFELKLVDNINSDNLLVLQNAIAVMLAQYSFKTHSRETLLDILKLAIRAKATNIDKQIRYIWKSIEKFDLGVADNLSFLVKFLKHLRALPLSNYADTIFKNIFNYMGEDMPKRIMPIILAQNIVLNIDKLPFLLDEFSKYRWNDLFKKKITQSVVVEIMKVYDVSEIAGVLDKINTSSYWFLEAFDSISRYSIAEEGLETILRDKANGKIGRTGYVYNIEFYLKEKDNMYANNLAESTRETAINCIDNLIG